MFSFQKFEPVHQRCDSGGWLGDVIEAVADWRSARKAPAPVVETALLSLRNVDDFRKFPVLALPPPPRLEVVSATKRAKRRGKYGPDRSLYWVLEIDGVLVRAKGGSVKRFQSKAAALAYA